MSVRERLEDAAILWQQGRKHGAWILVLIAAAATSRCRFPTLKDGEAFRKFIRQVSRTIISGDPSLSPVEISFVFNAESPDELPMDRLFYKHLRCNLLHEAMIGPEVLFSESAVSGGQLIANFKGGSPLTLPDFWVLHLARAVATASENAVTCADLFAMASPPNSSANASATTPEA